MFKKRAINWGPTLFLIIYHVILAFTLPVYLYFTPPSLSLVLISILLLYLTGLSITAGYHRYFAHRAFKTNPIIETILLFFGSMSCQGSILRWGYDHRLHHAHVDTDDDPYSIKKGFWYAHCLWIIDKPRTIDPKVVPDLMKNKRVMFQDRHYPILMVLTNVITFLAIGWLLNDYVGAFFLAWWTRMFFLHHFTWFINSLAHTWGDKPFCTEQTAVDNYIISLLTFGEGYHNYHHTYANDYRNGIKWYHFDPTKWLIWTLDKLGWVHGLKRMDPYAINKRLVIKRKELLLDKIRDLWYVKRDELEQKISDMSDSMVEKLSELNKLKQQYRESKKEQVKEIRQELKQLKRSIKQDMREWKNLSKQILHLQPLPQM